MSEPFPIDLRGPLPPILRNPTLLADCYRSDKGRLSGLKRRIQVGAPRLAIAPLLPPANTEAFAKILLRFHEEQATRDLLLEDTPIPGLPRVRRAVGFANAVYAYAADKLGDGARTFQDLLDDNNLLPPARAGEAAAAFGDETFAAHRSLCILMVMAFAILQHEDARTLLDALAARAPEVRPLLGL